MFSRSHLPVVLWFVLFALAIPFFNMATRIKDASPLPEHWRMPDAIGGWSGENLYYSTNPEITAAFTADDIIEPGRCPVSAAPLDTISPAERRLLPPDVTILRRLYRDANDRQRLVIGLVTGASREGIHRPEWCLAAQGSRIGARETMLVQTQSGQAFSVGVYPLIPAIAPDTIRPTRFFVYWFEGPDGYKTPHNAVRILRSGRDRIRQGRAQRWAYFSLQLTVPQHVTDTDTYLADAVKWLHDGLVGPDA